MTSELEPVRCPLSGDVAELVQVIPVQRILDAYQEIEREIGPLGVERFFSSVDSVEVYRSPVTGYDFYYPFDLVGDQQLYQRLSAIPWYYAEHKWEYDEALRWTIGAERLLELGCGRGAFLRKVSDRGTRAVGLEFNEEAVSFCLANGIEAWNRSIEEVAHELPSEFDAVVSFQVLEHIARPLGLLEAACRLLRVGGVLVLSVPNNDSYLFNVLDPLNAPPHHMGLWNVKSLLWLQHALPLRAIDIRYQPLSSELPLERLMTDEARKSAYRSWKRRAAGRVIGEDRLLAFAYPWIRAALDLAPGHTIQIAYERLADKVAVCP